MVLPFGGFFLPLSCLRVKNTQTIINLIIHLVIFIAMTRLMTNADVAPCLKMIENTITKISRSYPQMSKADMLSAAYEGLCKAWKSYDDEKGAFEKYAQKAVNQAIMADVFMLSSPLSRPESLMEDCAKITKAMKKYRNECECEPSVETVAAMCSLSIDHCAKVMKAMIRPVRLDDGFDSEDDECIAPTIEVADWSNCPDKVVDVKEKSMKLDRIFNGFSPKEKRILVEVYGKNCKLSDLGHLIDDNKSVSRQAATMHCKRLIKRMKALVDAEDLMIGSLPDCFQRA